MEKSAGVIIYQEIDSEIKYLIVKTKIQQVWGFPKGHLEDNETEKEAAIREVYEEVGLKVEMIEGFKESIQFIMHNGKEKKVSYFISKTNESNLEYIDNTIDSHLWLNYNELLTKLEYEDIKIIFKKAHKFIISNLSNNI